MALIRLVTSVATARHRAAGSRRTAQPSGLLERTWSDAARRLHGQRCPPEGLRGERRSGTNFLHYAPPRTKMNIFFEKVPLGRICSSESHPLSSYDDTGQQKQKFVRRGEYTRNNTTVRVRSSFIFFLLGVIPETHRIFCLGLKLYTNGALLQLQRQLLLLLM